MAAPGAASLAVIGIFKMKEYLKTDGETRLLIDNNQQRRNVLLMEKVGLSQRKERRRKSRTKIWFLFFSVHGQATGSLA
jgi:hypothetical protein